ncbi:hypothetical protein [Streptomyces sp. NPDC096152]|uniref:hypothetical protein n=1 Tax=Streptomyces sp. NPDC096152 TaxID=3366078 RepID=UPI003801A46E
MRISQPLLRSVPVAAAAALALGVAAGPAGAGPGISVATSGSTVSVTTSACGAVDGDWGTASLFGGDRADLGPGRQMPLRGTSLSQSAAWRGVPPGTYTVFVVCAHYITAGSQSVVVRKAPARTPSAASAPPRGVADGLGGGTGGHGTVTYVVGGALAAAALAAMGGVLRRRPKPYRL